MMNRGRVEYQVEYRVDYRILGRVFEWKSGVIRRSLFGTHFLNRVVALIRYEFGILNG